MQKGRLIVFEGPEFCGCSAQLSLSRTFLEELGYDLITTREPGCPKIERCGEIRDKLQNPEINKTPEQELEMILEDRTLHSKYLKQQINQGKLVLCNRRHYSTIAYQSFGGGLDLEDVLKRNERAMQRVRTDFAIFYDVTPGEAEIKGNERITSEADVKKLEWFEQKGNEFHEKVRQGYFYQLQHKKAFGEDISWIDARGKDKEVWLLTKGVLIQKLGIQNNAQA
jgi:dTMP kinase